MRWAPATASHHLAPRASQSQYTAANRAGRDARSSGVNSKLKPYTDNMGASSYNLPDCKNNTKVTVHQTMLKGVALVLSETPKETSGYRMFNAAHTHRNS